MTYAVRAVTILAIVVALGCGTDEPSALKTDQRDTASPEGRSELQDLFSLRNEGRLHAERDSEEGFADALGRFQKAVEQSPDTARDRLNLIRCLLFVTSEDPAGANVHLDAARRILGEDAGADFHYLEGLAKKRQGDMAGAMAAFRRATDGGAHLTEVWFQRGHAEEANDEVEAALGSYRRALELNDAHRPSSYRVAMTLQKLGRNEEFGAAFERFEALPEDPGDTEKCALTRVTLRLPDRARWEAEVTDLTLRDVTAERLGPTVPGRAVSTVLQTRLRSQGLLVCADGEVLFVPAGSGSGEHRWQETVIGSSANRATVGDLDNDGHRDLVVSGDGVRVFRGEENGTFTPVTSAVWLEGQTNVGVTLFDLDHDGDLDVVAALQDSAGVEVIRNNGDLTFSPIPSPFPGATPTNPARMGDAHDLDQGNDIDFVFPGAAGVPLAFLNKRDGTFRPVPLLQAKGRSLVLVEDLDGDGAPDLVAAGGTTGITVARNLDRFGTRFTIRLGDASTFGTEVVRDLALADLDNDGDLDLVSAGPGQIVVYRNVRGGHFERAATHDVAATQLETADLDGDGRLEIVVVTENQNLRVYAPGQTPYASWTLGATGRKDNLDSVGVVLEQHAGPLYQSRMIKRAGDVHLGLGAPDRSSLDGVRLRWPQGIIQSVVGDDLALDPVGRSAVTQKEGLVASCPFLYVRGADGWRFLTDVVGIAPLGEWVPAGTTPHLDPEEYVRIPGDALTAHDGQLELAITEELRETTYLDRVELVAVDHPERAELYLDESTRQGAYDPLRVWVVDDDAVSHPRGVWVGSRDVSGDLSPPNLSTARTYLHPYRESRSQWSGWVPPHAIRFALAEPARILLLNGRIAWYDSQVSYAVSQSGRGWTAPRLERDGRVLVADVGLPAGMDRTLVVPFAEAPLPAGTELRLTGQHRFLWNSLRLVKDATPVTLATPEGEVDSIRWRTLAVGRGRLRYHGYSRADGDLARHEQRYAYDDASADDPWPRARGLATAYGDVTELLHQHDDQLVVLVAGDGLVLDFDAPPPPPDGARRTWFLRVSGWAKESGYHVATGETIAPLPFRGMTAYPPESPEPASPDYMSPDYMSPDYNEYLRRFQTRVIRY